MRNLHLLYIVFAITEDLLSLPNYLTWSGGSPRERDNHSFLFVEGTLIQITLTSTSPASFLTSIALFCFQNQSKQNRIHQEIEIYFSQISQHHFWPLHREQFISLSSSSKFKFTACAVKECIMYYANLLLLFFKLPLFYLHFHFISSALYYISYPAPIQIQTHLLMMPRKTKCIIKSILLL